MTPIEQLTIVAVRILGLVAILWGTGAGATTLLESCGQMDLTYIDLFLRARLIAPAVLLILGIVLMVFGKKIARCLLHGIPLD